MKMKKHQLTSATSENLFTLKQVAEKWQVSLRSVQRLVGANKLKVVRIGRNVRVTESELERVINACAD